MSMEASVRKGLAVTPAVGNFDSRSLLSVFTAVCGYDALRVVAANGPGLAPVLGWGAIGAAVTFEPVALLAILIGAAWLGFEVSNLRFRGVRWLGSVGGLLLVSATLLSLAYYECALGLLGGLVV